MDLSSKIESLLFYKGEPQTFWELASSLRVDPAEIPPAIEKLRADLAHSGGGLVSHDDRVVVGAAPEMSDLFEQLRKEELSKDLSKAALETLSIILYRDGVSRSEINFIRGVNSGFILRALEVRGLIEKLINEKDARTYVYKPTLELLSFMGVGSTAELPDFEEVRGKLEAKLSGKQEDESIK